MIITSNTVRVTLMKYKKNEWLHVILLSGKHEFPLILHSTFHLQIKTFIIT